MFLVACGSGTNAGFGSSTVGDFSNASVKGNYTYEIVGWDLGTQGLSFTPFREAGVFTADGKGNISVGEDDFSEATSLQEHMITSGNYSIANDGTGDATLNFGNGGGVHVDVTVANSSRVYFVVDTIGPQGTALFANGYGTATLQDSTALSAAPSGTFVFRRHTITANQTNSTSAVGVISVSGGVVSGTEDVNQSGAITQRTITSGVFNPPDSQGRGTGSFTESSSGTTTFAYYVVNSGMVRLFTTDTGVSGLGEAEAQTGGPTFSDASLSGGYAFGADGDDSVTGLGGAKAVGRFTASSGNLTDGALDSNVDGNATSNTSFTGTYTVAANGRGTASPTGVSLPLIFYLVSPSRAYFLVDDGTIVEDGTADAQQTSTFSNSTMKAQFAFYMDGFDTSPNLWDRIGWLRGDGSGSLSLSELLNLNGSTNTSGIISGSYSVASNGRVTGSINNLSNHLVLYLVSGSSGYILQNDTGVQISGYMTKQQAP